MNREILRMIIEKYPLRGFIVQNENDTTMINLGAKHGVVLGSIFEVIKEKESIIFKGKSLNRSPETVAKLEITTVEPDISFARILDKKQEIKTDDKVREKIVDIVAMSK